MNLCSEEVLAVGALTQLESLNETIANALVRTKDEVHGGVDDVTRTTNSLLFFNQLVALSLGPVKRLACGGECLPKNITHELIMRRFVEYMVLSLANLFKKPESDEDPGVYLSDIQPQGSTEGGDNLVSSILGTYVRDFEDQHGGRSVLFRMMLFCLLQRKSVSIEDATQCQCDVYKVGLAIEVALVALSLCLNVVLEDEHRRYVPTPNNVRYFTSFWEFLITNRDFVGLFCDPCDLCPPCLQRVEQ